MIRNNSLPDPPVNRQDGIRQTLTRVPSKELFIRHLTAAALVLHEIQLMQRQFRGRCDLEAQSRLAATRFAEHSDLHVCVRRTRVRVQTRVP